MSRRRQNKLYFRYNKRRHIIQECFYALVVKPERRTTVALTSSSFKLRIKEVEDSFNSEADKGKDKLSL
jgi:hypothetical protein